MIVLVTVSVAVDMPTDPPIMPDARAPEPTPEVMLAVSRALNVIVPAAVVLLRDAELVPWMNADTVLLTVLRASAPAPASAAPMGAAAAEKVAATDCALIVGIADAVRSMVPAELSVDASL